MSNQNQQPQNQPRQAQSDTVKCRVIAGQFLRSHGDGEDGEDQFAKKGEVVEVSRRFYEKLLASRSFDTYQDEGGTTTAYPRVITDMPLELVEKSA